MSSWMLSLPLWVGQIVASVREAEKESKDIYEDLPLYQIEKEFGTTEGGKRPGNNAGLFLVYLGLMWNVSKPVPASAQPSECSQVHLSP